MSLTDQPTQRLDAVAAIETVGLPGVDGRWQPCRGGVVNSWEWAEEELLFADGWLLLTGPNGSGKTLTASMLVTVLLDADTSQTALSVSGKAAGTLTSLHTNRDDQEDRTGAWWLEYGLRDAESGHTAYVTTGLWLRASNGTLHRAFFIIPGRVGSELTLQRDRQPIRIDDLAEQLAAWGGELFTSSSKLRPKALAHLRAVGDERGYRQAIRTRLFSPLDEVQFDALVSVLRSLRSVRTAEAISPARMCEVLTNALPALDPDRLTVIAESMERIAELETQLQRTREEAKLLEATDRLYRRYLSAVAQVEAAALTAANTEFDAQARRTREATTLLQAAQAEQAEADAQHAATRTQFSQLEGRREAADAALRDHAGAELPHMELRATELATAADEAAKRAEQADGDATKAARQAHESADTARKSQQHLASLSEELSGASAAVGADAAFERLLVATTQLASVQPGTAPALEVNQLCETPLAWVQARLGRVRQVEQALRTHELAQQAERSAADDRRRAEDHEDTCRSEAEDATVQRQRAEAALVDEVAGWAGSARHLGPVPQELTTVGDDGPAGDRLDPDRLATWLVSSASAARSCIDLAGRQQTAATDAALAAAAAGIAKQARAAHETAQTAAAEAEAVYSAAQEQAKAESEAAEQQRAHAQAAHEGSVAAAEAELAASEQHLAEGVVEAVDAARVWTGQVRDWRNTLVYLAADAVAAPDLAAVDDVSADEALAVLDRLRPEATRLAVEQAHTAATTRLTHRVAAAEQQVRRAADAVAAVEADLTSARQAAPVPAAPPWRTRQPEDGTPLWALVDFAEHLTVDEADRLEGALLVAGVLDALVTPDGRAVAGDLTITATAPAEGRTLADMLQVDQDSRVDPELVARLLRAIPVDPAGAQPATGRLTIGVLTAAAPDGYRATFIGRTVRERARLQRVAALELAVAAAKDELAAAQQELSDRRQDVLAAAAERDAFPPLAALLTARGKATQLRLNLQAMQWQTTNRVAQADLRLHQALAQLDTAAVARYARVARVEQALSHAQKVADEAREGADVAERTAAERTKTAQRSEAARVGAATAQAQADAERAAFPKLSTVRAAHLAEDHAEDDLTHARAALVEAAERHRLAGNPVKDALRGLNRAAELPDGSLLPTDWTALRGHGEAVGRLDRQIEAYGNGTVRAVELLQRAGRDASTAADLVTRFSKATQAAEKARLTAARQAAAVAEARKLYGAEYDQLRRTRHEIADALHSANEQAERLVARRQDAAQKAAGAQSTLEGIAPHRGAAERRRDECLRQLGRLVDERLASVPEDLPTAPSGRPATLTAGLSWARRLLADRPASADRLGILTQARGRALVTLENSVRATSAALARFDLQTTLIGIEGTEWRRAVVADPDAVQGSDLHQTVQALQATAAQLEEDLREDVKRILKTGLFTQLRRDIQVRREAAQELVRQVRATLGRVRTDVANVGVEVEWTVRDDEDARRMVALISQPPSDETFEQMYTVLRQRMDETVGRAWAERVAHTFDYRAWHEWQIRITHSSFGVGGDERFRTVTARSNPLESLSTGERRLATMLPLLAAAWSMYSGEGYRGPRLLSIDEIDAAFDEPNLRQVLALLRSWQFDLTATAPSMTSMIKKETQRIVAHQVITAGQHRVTVPWLWEGHGEPQPLTLTLALKQPEARR